MRQTARSCLALASRTALALSLAATGGCGAGERTIDRMPPSASSASAPAQPGDSTGRSATPAGMGTMGDMAGMTGDADHDFLRMMSDHHKGLIVLAHMTKERADVASARADAVTLDAEQDKELDMMQTMLEKDFKDPYTPKVAAEHKAMADGLKGKRGADYARSFYQNVITHHQEALAMIDRYLPAAKNDGIKQMAAKMKMVQAKEITDYQQKVARLR